MSNAIEFEKVSKRFRMDRSRPRSFQEALVAAFRRTPVVPGEHEFWALKDVSFEVPRGATVGLIGPNGSGKSTSLNLIARIFEATSGAVRVDGRVTALLELGAGFHPELSGRDNIHLNGALMGLSRREISRKVEAIIDFSEVSSFIDVPVKLYSSGMYVRLGFSAAVHLDPDILLVDEVLAVGDAAFQHKCMTRIGELRRSGVTILLVSHDLGTVQALCERAVWFDHGLVRQVGNSTDVAMAYLNRVAEDEAAKSGDPQSPARTLDAGSRRWGTGEVEITDVEFLDASGAVRRVFLTGAEMNIRIRYRAAKRVLDPIFGMAIHSQQGAHICGPNTMFSGAPIEFVEGDGTVTYRIEQLPLLEGGYVVTVASHNREDSKMYAYHDRLYPFQVYPGATRERYGLVTMGGAWAMRPDDAEPAH
ncbi:MAG: ABC transporter ATP-binding protein [Thermoflexales bacterium]